MVADLRCLWVDRGSPKFDALSARTGFSRSALNDAVTRTNRLPSKRVISALVGALAPEDVDLWLARRARIAKGDYTPVTPAPTDHDQADQDRSDSQAPESPPPSRGSKPPSEATRHTSSDHGPVPPSRTDTPTPPRPIEPSRSRRRWERPSWVVTALIAVASSALASVITWTVAGQNPPNRRRGAPAPWFGHGQ